MRAVVADRHGGPEVLEVRDIPPPPQPRAAQTLLEVTSAGVNFSDVLTIAGSYPGPGIEAAGREAGTGRPVLAFLESGGYGELAVADRRVVFDAGGLDLEQAGGYGLVTLAVYFGLRYAVRVREGESVLVLAAAGGVGSTALQVARALGAGEVLAVASTPAKRETALRLGADAAFDYGAELPPADVLVDGVGGEAFLAAYRRMRRFGRALLLGASSGSPPSLPPFQEMRERGVAVAPFSFKALREREPDFVARAAPEGLDLIRTGAVTPLVQPPRPLDEAAAALAALADRGTVGKLVLRP
jgi:NADPH2:quinone reductase